MVGVYYISTNSGLVTYPSLIMDTYTNTWDSPQQIKERKEETKKQRRDRLSKERMYASWSAYNLKTISIKEVLQICKPHHRLPHSYRRG